MTSYTIDLREIRLAAGETDDVALFDVTRAEDGKTWIVPTIVTPLFRMINMRGRPSPESRRHMVAGLGAQALVSHLRRTGEPPLEGPLLLGLEYPGAPGDPEPLQTYEHVVVEID